MDRADPHRPDRPLAGLGHLLQEGPDHHHRLRQRRRPHRRPVAAQVQERRHGHGEEHRRVARLHQGDRVDRDGARGRAAAHRQDDLLGGQARAVRRQHHRPGDADVRFLHRHAAVSRAWRGQARLHRQDRSAGAAGLDQGHDLHARQQAAGLDQPRFADLLPRSRGRHGAGLGYRRPRQQGHHPRLRARTLRSVRARRLVVLECLRRVDKDGSRRRAVPHGIAARRAAGRHRLRDAAG